MCRSCHEYIKFILMQWCVSIITLNRSQGLLTNFRTFYAKCSCCSCSCCRPKRKQLVITKFFFPSFVIFRYAILSPNHFFIEKKAIRTVSECVNEIKRNFLSECRVSSIARNNWAVEYNISISIVPICLRFYCLAVFHRILWKWKWAKLIHNLIF